MTKLLAAGACLAVVAAIALVQFPPSVTAREDLKPTAHWVFDGTAVTGTKVTARAGTLHGTLTGTPKLSTDGPTPCLMLSGPEDGVTLDPAITPAHAVLPKEAISIVAWVRIDRPQEWGAILGCFQDNRPSQKGFVLGYDKSNFFFGLAGSGPDGDGKMTYLSGKTNYVPGKWYHVAGTYNGHTMRLYVNDEEDGTASDQSGPIRYAAKAPFVIGRYKDDNEDFGMTGAIREVLLVPGVVPKEAIVAHFKADEKLVAAEAVGVVGVPKFIIEPYLQYATRTSIIVMCETDVPTTCSVEYGTNFPPDKATPADVLGVMHEIKLDNLLPRTKYVYRMALKGADGTLLTSRLLTFMTAVDPDDAWSFAVIGDTQANPKVTAKVAKLMWERRPHFVMHCGDVVDDGASKRMWTDELFKPCLELFGRVPVFPCIGNHEKNHPQYYKYFSLPAPEYYYSYRYGNAEFFSLDTNKGKDLKPGGVQYEWLDKALAKSDAKWKICYHHHPVYSSDSDDYGDTFRGKPSTEGDVRVRPLAALYEKHKVDLVFNGHIHLYERSWPIKNGKVDPTGVIHITSGGGGGSLEDFGPTPTFFKAECRVDFHFCYLTVHRGVLNFKAFDQEGRLFDTLTIDKDARKP